MHARRTAATINRFAVGMALALAVLIAGSQPPVVASSVGGASAAEATAGPVVRAPGRPNIVVVMADDMRVDDLRFAPNVRRLVARKGVTFENSFSPFPLCCPARASFLTGLYSHNHKVYWHEKPYAYAAFDDSLTIATSLQQAGYQTGFIGKYVNRYGPDRSLVSGLPSYRYVPRGWSRWVAAIENPQREGIHGGTYDYLDTPFNVDGTIDNRYRGRYQTNVIGDFSVDMVQRFTREPTPFFMYVNFVAPHHGSPSEPDDPAPYRDESGHLQDYLTPARPDWVKGRFDEVIRRGAGMPRDGGPSEPDVSDKPAAMRRLEPIGPTARRALTTISRQRAEAVFVMDGEIGRLVRALKDNGEWARTWFVFTSDNGYFLGEHRKRQGKVLAYEPSLRVPLLMTGPGHRAGESRYDSISTVDLTATLLDLAGAEPPRRPDGVSKLAVLRSGDRGWDVPIVTEAINTAGPRMSAWKGPRTSIGLRTARYSYTRYRNGQVELYDMVADPLQLSSVHADPDYRSVRTTLRAAWDDLRSCRGAACRMSGPEALSATAAQNREITVAYWRAVRNAYGWGSP